MAPLVNSLSKWYFGAWFWWTLYTWTTVTWAITWWTLRDFVMFNRVVVGVLLSCLVCNLKHLLWTKCSFLRQGWIFLFIPKYSIWERFLISEDIGKSFLKFESARYFVVNWKLWLGEIVGKVSLLDKFFPAWESLQYQENSSLSGKLFPTRWTLPCLGNSSMSGKLFLVTESFPVR